MYTSEFPAQAFSNELYANSLPRKLARSAALGWRYYVWDWPRYLMHRRAAGLRWMDFQAAFNPLYEFFDRKREAAGWPAGGAAAIDALCAVGVRFTLPPSRVAALVRVWQDTRQVEGDVIECGSYRGATALLIAMLGKHHGRD